MGRLATILKVVIILYLVAFISSKLLNSDSIKEEILSNGIAVIKIEGPIVSSSSNSILGQSLVGSNAILENLNKAEKSKGVKAIILEINSPGGTVVASKEIAEKVASIEKPTIALIREVGASGAYWVASASDLIVADELSITGSIGVISSYIQFSGLLDDHNVTYERLVTGEFKDLGSPYKPLTSKERNLLQKKLDIIEAKFVEDVAKNREMPLEQVQKLADGSFYLGIEALENGLIDLTGNKDTAILKAKELANIENENVVEYIKKPSLLNIFEKLTTQSFYSIGQGLGDSMQVEEELVFLAK
ncbi:MAG: signal peptide peptidase SppA [Nanoarchaeota archaeon]|nr:signal peptide peptidase SppA [Nanoarchaeota archaeon]|tara:strand:- start:4672 stop:5583 length:912 start_codon:yes stop_codon:yes gene_type:complete